MRILLIDDNEAVRLVLMSHLERAGHIVIAVDGAVPAERIWQCQIWPFDMVIADYNLGPGRSGLDLLLQFAPKKPDLRLLLMSGAPLDVKLPAQVLFLQKPFTRIELLSLVGRAQTGST